MTRPVRALLVLALLAVAGCGGEDARKLPGDYAEVSQLGATFSLPPGMKAGAVKGGDDDSESVSFTGSDDVAATIFALPGRGDAFKTLPDQQRATALALSEELDDGQESVDIPGAEDAYLLSGTAKGGDGPVDTASVGARKGDDVWVLNVYAKRDGDADAAAIARSLGLGEG